MTSAMLLVEADRFGWGDVLPTTFPLADRAAAFQAVGDRTVVKAVIDPTGQPTSAA